MDCVEQIRNVLGTGTSHKSSTACAILDILEKTTSEEEKIKLLSIAFIERDSVSKQPKLLESPYIISDEVWELLKKKHLVMVRAFVKSTYFSTNSIGEFSREMLRLISFFREKDEKIFTLATILYYDDVMPYRQLPATPLQMTDSEYIHLLKSNSERIQMIQYIAMLPFDSYTEEISMVLQVIDECEENKPLRVALLSAYVTLVEKRLGEKQG